ncbi:MAG: trypsin-like peptidase domain-containing protein [Solirubrobacteraceae bacterium]
MLVVDLTIAALIVAALAWGFARGLDRMLPLAGFAVGAVLGTRIPVLLGGDLDSTFSLVAALPASLVLGALLAALVERFGPQARRSRRPRPRPRSQVLGSGVGGALVASSMAVVAVWILGPVATQVSSVRKPVEDSSILARFNAVLTPAGPEPNAPAPSSLDNFPTVAGPPPEVPAADASAETDPDVVAAERSIVKIGFLSCGHGGQGSGWVVADQIVVTNAHVAASVDAISARSRGTGRARPATVIWFDPINDLALLRVPKLRGVPPLRMVRRPQSGTSGAALGFPLGIRDIRRARLGPTTRKRQGRLGGRLSGPGFKREIFGRLVTTFKARTQPGSSGGPVVDRRGRVLTTVFGGGGGDASGLGVPNRFVRAALRKAGPTVSTGRCLNDSDRDSPLPF